MCSSLLDDSFVFSLLLVVKSAEVLLTYDIQIKENDLTNK